jgi:hypothetical protein
MVAQVKPTTKNSPPVKTGANRDNKPASAYAGRYKEAMPELNARANMSKVDTVNASVGNISKAAGDIPTKTNGIKIRGTGAATKGLYARGPLA